MHTSFEDLRTDKQSWLPPGGGPDDVLMHNGKEWVWHRPRSYREAGYRRSVMLTLIIGIGLGVPLAVALVFILT